LTPEAVAEISKFIWGRDVSVHTMYLYIVLRLSEFLVRVM